jgi:hypothetical protein
VRASICASDGDVPAAYLDRVRPGEESRSACADEELGTTVVSLHRKCAATDVVIRCT